MISEHITQPFTKVEGGRHDQPPANWRWRVFITDNCGLENGGYVLEQGFATNRRLAVRRGGEAFDAWSSFNGHPYERTGSPIGQVFNRV